MKQNYEKSIIEGLFHEYFPQKKILSYRLCEIGIENSNFLVETDGGGYILKVFETVDELDFVYAEVDAMIALRKKGIHIPELFLSSSRDAIIFTQENKPVILMEYIQGEKLYDTPPTPAVFFQIGQRVAEFQNAFGELQFPWNPQETNFFNLVYIFEHQELRSICPSYADITTLKEVWEGIDAIAEDFLSLPRQIIHNDLNNSNIIYGNGEPYFIDFSDATMSPCIADIAILLASFCFRLHWLPEGMTDFLRGYETVRRLTQVEKSCLFPAIEARSINNILAPYLDPRLGSHESLLEYTTERYRWLERFHTFGKEQFDALIP